MNIAQPDLKLDILRRKLPVKLKETSSTKSYKTRRLEGENSIDLLDEYLGSFQTRKKKTEQSLKYFIERCAKNEKKVRKILRLYNSPNSFLVSINSVEIILRDIIELKERFIAELNKRCVTRIEYRERIGVTYKLIADFMDCTNNIDILDKIFLENSN